MGVFEQFPYANFHELNADWLIKELLKLKTTVEEFVSINALKYADPIQWSIVRQYEKNTIVIDPLTGTAYISVQPVPSGVALTRTEYWTVVFDLGSFVVRAAKNFTDNFEEDTTLTATFPSAVNDWLIWGDTLYRVISNIVAGDQYVIGSNIEHFTAEDVIGHIQDLDTTDKTNLVAAINEVLQFAIGVAGDLSDLDTELNNKIDDINDLIGNETLDTQASTLIGAINEILAITNVLSSRIMYVTPEMFGAVGDGVTDDTQALTEAFTYKYVRLSDKTYIATDSITVSSSIVEGNHAKILFNNSAWKYNALLFVASDYVEISNLEVDANDNVGQCFRIIGDNDAPDPLDHINIMNCTASNSNNKSSMLNATGIEIEKESYIVSIQGCKISNINRESSNPGTSAARGIGVNNAIGTVLISNNIIDGVHIATDGSKIDADGIALFARDFSNSEDEKTSFTISNNLLMNCQGRFFKIKSEYCKIVQNTCRNEDIEVIDYFRCVDLQTGGGEVANNTMKLINCTSAGTHASFVKVADYDYDKAIVNASVHDNSFYNDVPSIFYNGVGIYIPNTIPAVINISNNQFANAPRVVYISASAGDITTGYAYVFIDGNSILGTYSTMLSAGATPTAHSTVYKNNNIGDKETNLLHKDIDIAADINTHKLVIDNIASQITDLGITVGNGRWLSHGTGAYIVFRITTTQYKVIWLYNDIYFYSSVDNKYFQMDGTEI